LPDWYIDLLKHSEILNGETQLNFR